MTIRVFPVQGGASFPNDFASVATANLRKHLGNDLFAPAGTSLLAVDNGTIKFGTDTLGGNVANLYADDGTKYYYAHLSRFEGLSGRRIRTGEIIGYIGTTGNAQGTPPHTHFEVHPASGGTSPWNGPAINPFSELQWALNHPMTTAIAPSVAIRKAGGLVLGVLALGAGAWYYLRGKR